MPRRGCRCGTHIACVDACVAGGVGPGGTGCQSSQVADILFDLVTVGAGPNEKWPGMARREKLLRKIQRNPNNVAWVDFYALCVCTILANRSARARAISYSSLRKWAGQPTVNIQPLGKQAKGYQVREVLRLIEKSPRGRR